MNPRPQTRHAACVAPEQTHPPPGQPADPGTRPRPPAPPGPVIVQPAAPRRLPKPARQMMYGLLVWGCSTAQAALPPHQRQALVELYQLTQGPLWRQSANWLQDDPCDHHWHGVSCSADGLSVIGLHLPGNRLQGVLPDSLKDLESLESLDLRGNLGLTGPLPPLRAWPALTHVNLSFNQFSGHLPPLRLPQLQSLVLSNNLLTGPLPELSGLPALQNLRINHNQFNGPLPSLNALSALQALDLSFNQFSGPLPELSPLGQLNTFLADWNRFQGPLPNPSGLLQLQTLSATGNQLSGPLPPLRNLPALGVLALNHNQLSGPLPRLLDLPQLHQLSLAYNLFTGPLPDLSSARQLKRLQVEGNQLSGPLPERPGQLIQASLCPNSLQDPPQAMTIDPVGPVMTWRGCAPSETTSPDEPRTSPKAARPRRAPGPDRAGTMPPKPSMGCLTGPLTDNTQPHRPRSDCPATSAPRRGSVGKPLPDPSVLPPWSEWVVALSALLALVTVGLIWRLSWLGRENPPTNREATEPDTTAAPDSWLNSHTPPPGDDAGHFGRRPSWPPA